MIGGITILDADDTYLSPWQPDKTIRGAARKTSSHQETLGETRRELKNKAADITIYKGQPGFQKYEKDKKKQ